MRTVHFFSLNTGLLSAHSLRISSANADAVIKANTPPDHAPIEGVSDPISQRVDLETRQIIDYQPSAPDEDHEWNTQIRRWALKPDIAKARADRSSALAQIATIEQSQQRAVRELAIEPTNATARAKLIDTDARIAKLRDVLTTNSKVKSIG